MRDTTAMDTDDANSQRQVTGTAGGQQRPDRRILIGPPHHHRQAGGFELEHRQVMFAVKPDLPGGNCLAVFQLAGDRTTIDAVDLAGLCQHPAVGRNDRSQCLLSPVDQHRHRRPGRPFDNRTKRIADRRPALVEIPWQLGGRSGLDDGPEQQHRQHQCRTCQTNQGDAAHGPRPPARVTVISTGLPFR